MAEPHPGFWMHETSGVLRPTVEAYLFGRPMTEAHIAAMRAYLRQWIAAPAWQGAGIVDLRERVDLLTTRQGIRAWLDDAVALGIDPL